MEKVIGKASDHIVMPNGMMEQGKEQTIMEGSMSEKVMLQSKQEKQIEQQEGSMERGTKRTTPIALTCGRKTLKQVNGKLMGERKSIINLW